MEQNHLNTNSGIRVRDYGAPSFVEGPAPLACEPDQLLVELVASPINPADLLEIDGRYAGTRLPLTPGAEGVGRVLACGSGVSQARPGDLVLHLTRGNWQRFRQVRESEVLALPPSIDPKQAALIRVNPATALLLLTDVLRLQTGDAVAFNGAGSAVGRLLAGLGASRGLRMLAVARAGSNAVQHPPIGVHSVLVDDEQLGQRLREMTRGAGVRLALDCVAGPASARLVEGLAEGGTLCVYGHLSGQDCHIPSRRLTFGQVQVCGFNLGRALARRSPVEQRHFYSELAARVAQGEMHTPIAAVYPLERIDEALAHAAAAPGAKVLLNPSSSLIDKKA